MAKFPLGLTVPRPELFLDHNHESYVARQLVNAVLMDPQCGGCSSLASPELVSSTEVLDASRIAKARLTLPIPAKLVASSSRVIRDMRLLPLSRLDSFALLDATTEGLDHDPCYPSTLGRAAFLDWLKDVG